MVLANNKGASIPNNGKKKNVKGEKEKWGKKVRALDIITSSSLTDGYIDISCLNQDNAMNGY